MYAALGFIFSTLAVALGRIVYVFIFERELLSLEHLLSISPLQQFIYVVVILIGTFNMHQITKIKKSKYLFAELLGTFIFSFGLNFINQF